MSNQRQSKDIQLTEPVVMLLGQSRTGNNLHLTWNIYLTGDFNRNGRVDISDVTPIAVYYGHMGSENNYMRFITGSDGGSVGVSCISAIAARFGIKVTGIEIWLAPQDGDLRLVKRLDWSEYDVPLDGVPHYTADVELEDSDMYYWVTAVMEPDPSWHEDYIWSIPAETT
jgi:hypothetical protein